MARKKGKKKGNQKKRPGESVRTFSDAYKKLQTHPPDISNLNENTVPINAYYEEDSLEIDTERNETPPFPVIDNTWSNDQVIETLPDLNVASFNQRSKNQELNLPTSITVALAGASHYGGFSQGKVLFHAEPENPYDPNAVAVFQDERMIGHLPRVLVANLAKRKAVLDHGYGTIVPNEGIHIVFDSLNKNAMAPITPEVLTQKTKPSIEPVTSPNQRNKSKETMKLIDVCTDGNYLIINTDQGDFKNRIDYAPPGIIEKCKKHIGHNIELTVRAGTGAGGKSWQELGWFVDIKEAGSESNTKSVDKKPNEQSFETRLPLGKKFDGHTSQKVYGPPGTGKTTLMLDHIRKQLEADVSPEDIAFISFSNAGANAAKKRVSESFPGYGSIDFPNFSTMHSLATKVGGGSGKTLCQEEHWKAFDKTIICFNEWTEVNDPSSIVVRYGHPVLDLASLAISRCTSFATQHDHIVGHDDRTQANIKESLSQYFGRNLLANEVVDYAERYLLAYKTFKEDRNLVDFNDVIERIISDEFDDSLMPTFEVLIIDEAQDLSDFLWIFARKLIERAKVVYVAGDDDQAIMINFGASPHAFLNLPTTEKDYPLPKSYRVPEEVMSYVRSGTLKYVEELPNRVDKDWGTADHQGDVSPLSERPIQDQNGSSINGHFEDFTVNDLLQRISISREEDWLVMAPTRATGERFSKALLEQQPAIPHFYRNKPYPNLSDLNNCKIRIQTVHASKGDQAENVAIIAESFGDVFMLVTDPRLAYVALTRAKRSMYPRVLKEGLLPSMSGAGQKWRSVAARFNDMFPGQHDN